MSRELTQMSRELTPTEQPTETPVSRERGFFHDHPRFLETSTTAAGVHRLNLRHQALIEANRDVLAGARVLDIASHNGRWSLAALEAGAAHVTGVEAGRDLVDHSERTCAMYGAAPESYRFVTGDVYSVLPREELQIDVIVCFGFLYHTLRYPEFLSLLRRLEPRYLLLDTRVLDSKGKVIKVSVDEAAHQGHAAVDDYTVGSRTLVGTPSPAALRLMLRTYGFRVESEFDWAQLSKGVRANLIGRYKRGERVTWRCRRDATATGTTGQSE